MILVVGLGNPGKRYEYSRHNIGFMVIDRLKDTFTLEASKEGFHSIYLRTLYKEKRMILAKPQTFMNRSGDSVSEIVNYFNISIDNLIVVHDEIDIQYGVIKIKSGGGSAGHNGVQSIIGRLGNDNFTRLRMGVGKPLTKTGVVNHVLSDFDTQERNHLDKLISFATQAIYEVIDNGNLAAMNKYNNLNVIESEIEDKNNIH